MQKTTKLFAIFICLALMLAVLAGCADNQVTGDSSSEADEGSQGIDDTPSPSDESSQTVDASSAPDESRDNGSGGGADGDVSKSDASWRFSYLVNQDSKSCEIRGITGSCTSGHVIIPSEIDGYEVTRINSVDLIDDETTAITYVSIPDSVTFIGENAFFGRELLTKIDYTGTIEQWKQISIGNTSFFFVGTDVVHCTDGDCTIRVYD